MDPNPCYFLVHPLPAAPRFVGREVELEQLRALWHGGFHGVLALVGLGGAGKTALAARFLEELTSAPLAKRPGRLFLWSFYQEPDAGLFLERAFQFFSGQGLGSPAKGTGLLHLLGETLGKGGNDWLVLDGLERVQVQESSPTRTYGQIEDPLLRNLLIRIAKGMGRAVVLATSRFPLADLNPFTGQGYCHVPVGDLNQEEAIALLGQRGVEGDDAILASLVERYGAHPLTLDHLGGLIGQFLDGNPYRAPELADLASQVKDRQAFRLARLLRAYEEHLPPAELALLCRLCLLRRSVKEEHVLSFFLCSPPVHGRLVREIGHIFQTFPGLTKLVGDRIPDLTEAVRAILEEALCEGPIAGPEEVFRSEMVRVAEKLVENYETPIDFADFAYLYERAVLDYPTDLLPLEERDRKELARLYARYKELKERTEGVVSGKGEVRSLSADYLVALKNMRRGLCFLAGKHFALRRVRELCRTFQHKWSQAGPLATLDAADMRRLLDNLVSRNLVQREADGSYSVHPAVRDHFHRLAMAESQGAWHDILREQLVSLVQQPGQRQPHDAATLDLVEEAIYHAQQAGRNDEAHWLYRQVLGGLRHLGWKLGEIARGLRILRSFQTCPEDWDLGWFLRALGEFEEAFRVNPLAYFRADILLLQGRLPEVAAVGDSTRTLVADFLMGKTTALSPDPLGSTIPFEQLLLYLGRLEPVRRSVLRDALYRDLNWEGSRSRCQLLAAEAARRQGDEGCCQRLIEEAAGWILHAGSVEHLGLLHLIRSRYFRQRNLMVQARQEVTEGLHIVRQCGLRLFLVDLLCEQAEIFLASGELIAAEQAAREAHTAGLAGNCRFMWGAAHAGHLLGLSLFRQTRREEARDLLQQTLDLRRRIGDPEGDTTEQFLAAIK